MRPCVLRITSGIMKERPSNSNSPSSSSKFILASLKAAIYREGKEGDG